MKKNRNSNKRFALFTWSSFDNDFDYDGGNVDVVVGEASGDDVDDVDGVDVELSPGGQAILACLFDVGNIVIMIMITMRMILMVLSSDQGSRPSSLVCLRIVSMLIIFMIMAIEIFHSA